MPGPTLTPGPAASIKVAHFLIKLYTKSVYIANLVIRVLSQLSQRARLRRDIMQGVSIACMLKPRDV